MTKADKAFLRWLMRNKPEIGDDEAARQCDCAASTVRRYRKALAN